jgi:hypothetical protein
MDFPQALKILRKIRGLTKKSCKYETMTKFIGNGTYIVSELDGSSFKEPSTGNRLMSYKMIMM